MIHRVRHLTRYTYSEPVFLEPHHLYFTPLPKHHLHVNKFDIKIIPEPSGITACIDIENNAYHQIWFNDLIKTVEMHVDFEIDIQTFNPIAFLVEDESRRRSNDLYAVYLECVQLDTAVNRWIDQQIAQSDEDRLSALININKAIKEKWGHEVNYSEELMAPNDCFKTDNASCRDLSWMMINMVRSMGTPSRFVSGYSFNPELEEGHELHAWVEAWVDGAGWVGFDPSSGIMVTENYIPVCASYHPTYTLPVQGRYRGKATSHLHTEVMIDAT